VRSDKKFPWVEFDHKESYKSETEQYDKVATTYLLWIMSPIFIGCCVYLL